MSTLQSAQIYRNVMEPLVIEEVEQQIQHLPTKVAQYVNRTDVIAYALNRLPPLYATSERGWHQQQSKVERELRSQIKAAVRQAFAAVQQDPIRSVVPLKGPEQAADKALQALKELLHVNELSWQNVVDRVEHVLIQTARGEMTWRKRGSALSDSQEWNDRRYRL